MSKHRTQRKIDSASTSTSISTAAKTLATGNAGGSFIADTPNAPAPTSVAVSANLSQADRSATAIITVVIVPPTDAPPISGYTVQLATDPAFGSGTITQDTATATTGFSGMAPGTSYYVRAAIRYSDTLSGWTNASPFPLTTPQDTTPPGAITNLGLTWAAEGSATWRWSPPVDDPRYQYAHIIIRTASNGPQLFTTFAYNEVTFTREQNRALANLSATLYIEIRSQSWAGARRSDAVTMAATKLRPATPTGLTSTWSGDSGMAPADVTISCANQADAYLYRWTIDGVAQADTYLPSLTYSLDANAAQHSGTPDPVLSLSVVAVDGLNQVSASAATATATNAAPPTLASLGGTISASGHFTLDVVITQPSRPADWQANRIVVRRGGSVVANVVTREFTKQFGNLEADNYQIVVSVIDLFGQESAETTTSAAYMPLVTVRSIRAGATYTNSKGTASDLLAGLKDEDTDTTVITYP